MVKERENDRIRQSADGNLTIQMKDAVLTNVQDTWYLLSVILDSLDCYFVGEQYCLGNFDMAQTIYNAHDDLVYVLPMSDVTRLMNGEAITLFAKEPDEDDREMIEQM